MCLNFTKTVSSDLVSCIEKKLNNQDIPQFQCYKISFQRVRETKISSVIPQPSSRRAMPNRKRIGTM